MQIASNSIFKNTYWTAFDNTIFGNQELNKVSSVLASKWRDNYLKWEIAAKSVQLFSVCDKCPVYPRGNDELVMRSSYSKFCVKV